jgi:hypothetical protein
VTYYGVDRWLFPIRIVAGQNVLRVLNVSTGITSSVTIAPGTYYQAIGLPSGYSSLPDAIRIALNTEVPTITTSSVNPAGQTSSILDNSAFRYTRSTFFYRFQFADALFTFPRRLLGFTAGTNTNTGNNPPPIVSMLGSWQTFTMLDGGATDKRRTALRELYVSTQELYPTTRQHSVRTDRKVRTFTYDYVPGLHVYESDNRAFDSEYIATSGLATGDNNNAFESVWRSASNLDDIIIVHDTGNGSATTNVTSQDHEIARLYNPDQRADFRACFEDLSLGGELYRISVDMLIIGGNYDY